MAGATPKAMRHMTRLFNPAARVVLWIARAWSAG
jgi:hypothetical protein